MSFLIRAALVIGALSYFALRGAPGERGADVQREAETLSAALKDLPAEIRTKATQAAEAEILRRLAAAGPSQDTLIGTDRHVSWRGGEGR